MVVVVLQRCTMKQQIVGGLNIEALFYFGVRTCHHVEARNEQQKKITQNASRVSGWQTGQCM